MKTGNENLTSENVSILAKQVRKKIIDRVKESKYFCIIFDSTPDVSHKDQMRCCPT